MLEAFTKGTCTYRNLLDPVLSKLVAVLLVTLDSSLVMEPVILDVSSSIIAICSVKDSSTSIQELLLSGKR